MTLTIYSFTPVFSLNVKPWSSIRIFIYSDDKILLRFCERAHVNYDSWYSDINEAFDVLEAWTDDYELHDTHHYNHHCHEKYYLNRLRYAKYVRTVKPKDRRRTPYKNPYSEWLLSLPQDDFFAIK